jgi:hypothetical protein
VMGRRTYDLGEAVDGFVETPYRVEHSVLTHGVPERVARGETRVIFVRNDTGINRNLLPPTPGAPS